MNTFRFLTTLAVGGGLSLGAYWYLNDGRWPVRTDMAAVAAAADRTPLFYRDPGG